MFAHAFLPPPLFWHLRDMHVGTDGKQMGKGGQSPAQILSELGLMGVWGGLGTRVLMIGTLTGESWLYICGGDFVAGNLFHAGTM